jgi:hypothetical protein
MSISRWPLFLFDNPIVRSGQFIRLPTIENLSTVTELFLIAYRLPQKKKFENQNKNYFRLKCQSVIEIFFFLPSVTDRPTIYK